MYVAKEGRRSELLGRLELAIEGSLLFSACTASCSR